MLLFVLAMNLWRKKGQDEWAKVEFAEIHPHAHVWFG
jgi:hypothetical protein